MKTRKFLTNLAGLALVLLATMLAAEEPPWVAGSETLVVFPDTEGYARKRPQVFDAMCQWVADQQEARKVRGLLHVGDVTNDNLHEEWKNARKAFDLVEGKLPYVLAAGNHDYDHTEGRLTYMNEYFKVADLKKWQSFGGVFEEGKLENHYQFLTIHNQPWIVLSLEMGPRKKVVAWANQVLNQHRDRHAIILTHGYLYYNNERYDHLKGSQRATPYNFYGEGADGEMLWNDLVRLHPNIMLVICGHLSSAYVGYRQDEGDYGNLVHQMLVDYEKLRGGGMGFLRLLEFLPDRETVQVRTYSPVTGGKNPVKPELEEFRFKLRAATRTQPRRPETALDPAYRPPVHRWTFAGKAAGDGAIVRDAVGGASATLRSASRKSQLTGQGQLKLASNDEHDGYLELPPRLLRGKSDAITVEVFFTPTAKEYNWNTVWKLGDDRGGRSGDFFWHCFRTLHTHRSEVIDEGHNTDIQAKEVPVEVGRPLHVAVAYLSDGGDGQPLLRYYRNGELAGSLKVPQKLANVNDIQNRLGPFAAVYEEFRIYDYAWGPSAAKASYLAGPNKLP